jgi:ferredoxin-NADP reductase
MVPVAYRGRIVHTVNHTPNVRSLFFRLGSDVKLEHLPGQFISLSVPAPSGIRVKPYTIASIPKAEPSYEILFNLVPNGIASNYLFGLKAGDAIDFTGPFGTFTLAGAPDRDCVFVAETTAIAPIRPMIHRVLSARDHKPVRLIYAAPSRDELIYRNEFERAASEDRGFVFEPNIVGLDVGSGNLSAMRELIESRYIAGANRDRRFFICGVGNGVIELRDLLRGAGYERRAVQYERW